MKAQVYENTKVVTNNELHNQELYNQENKPIARNLALTVRKEHRLTVVKNVTKTTIRMSWKTLLYLAFLTVATMVV